MHRLTIPRALAAAALAALALTLSTTAAGAVPVVDVEIDANAVSPVPLPVDATAEATVDPAATPPVCVDVSVNGTPAGTCGSGGGALPVPLPTGGAGGLPGTDVLGPAAVCLAVPEVCLAQATAPLGGLTGALPAAPTGALPPVAALPGLLAGGTTIDACASVGVLADARGCGADAAGDGSGGGGSGDGSGGSSGAGKPGLAFTGGNAGLVAASGGLLLALGLIARRLARVGASG